MEKGTGTLVLEILAGCRAQVFFLLTHPSEHSQLWSTESMPPGLLPFPAPERGLAGSVSQHHDGEGRAVCPGRRLQMPWCRLQRNPNHIPTDSIRAKHFALSNVQFSALLKLAARTQAPSVWFSPVLLEKLCTPQLSARIRASCSSLLAFRPFAPLLDTAGSAERGG